MKVCLFNSPIRNFAFKQGNFDHVLSAQNKAFDAMTKYKEKHAQHVQKYIQKHFPNGVDNYSAQEILNGLGIKTKIKENGLLIISDYGKPIYSREILPIEPQPSQNRGQNIYQREEDIFVAQITYQDLGIDENKLFKQIEEIKGDANFSNSRITDFGSLKEIGGDGDFSFVKAKSLNHIKTIGKNASFYCSNLKDLGDLEYIGGWADFRLTLPIKINNLKHIAGKALIINTSVNPELLEKITDGEIIS